MVLSASPRSFAISEIDIPERNKSYVISHVFLEVDYLNATELGEQKERLALEKK